MIPWVLAPFFVFFSMSGRASCVLTRNATVASAATVTSTKKRKVVTTAGLMVNPKAKRKATVAKPKDPATPLSPLSGKGKGAGKSMSPPGTTDRDTSRDTVSKAEFTVLLGDLRSLAGDFKAF